MKNINVYNLRKLVEGTEFKNLPQMTTQSYHELAIIQGDKGIMIIDDEAVGRVAESLDETFKLGICENKENVIYALPQYTINIPIHDIINKAECREVPIREFVRKFGSRLENNFKIALKTIDEIGLDSKEYYNEAN